MKRTIVPTVMNPSLDPALEAEVAFFKKWGYLIVEDALDASLLPSLRRVLDATVERDGKEFVHQLLEEDDAFVPLLDNPPILTRIKALLGNCIQLHSATARVTSEVTPDQSWHRDGPWPMDPDGTPYGSLPGQINCAYFLDELTEESGAFVIVPGSHRSLFRPPEGHPRFPDELRILARPGQAVMFDGWIYHRGAANTTGVSRRACLMCYQNAWMKSREPFDGPRVTALRETGTPEQQLLLGGVTRW